MAELALGFGTSHTLMKDPVYWLRRGETARSFLQHHCGLDPDQLPTWPELEAKLTRDYCEAQFQACNAAVETIGDVLQEEKIDAMLMVTNQHGRPKNDYQPIFGIYVGELLPIGQLPREEGADTGRAGFGLQDWTQHAHPAHPGLALHVLDSLIADGFDISCMDGFREGKGIGHEHTVLYDDYLREETPVVPFELSRYLPHQATPARCYTLGQALRRAIDSWDSDQRVAIVASGGLSHQLVDEELDRAVIAALIEKDRDYLSSLPRDRLNVLPGTAEILNWVTVAGATEDLQMTLVDYVPSYWSTYGTGHGFCFSYWR